MGRRNDFLKAPKSKAAWKIANLVHCIGAQYTVRSEGAYKRFTRVKGVYDKLLLS